MTGYIDGIPDGRCSGGGGGSTAIISGVEDIPELRTVTGYTDKVIIGVKNPATVWIFDVNSVVPDNGSTVVKPDDILPGDPGRWILTGSPGSFAVEFIYVNFTFASISPLTIATLVAGQSLAAAELVIETVFDDASATLALGTFADPIGILPTNYNAPNRIGNYGNDQNYLFTVGDSVILTLAPGASTQGSGYVYLEIKRS